VLTPVFPSYLQCGGSATEHVLYFKCNGKYFNGSASKIHISAISATNAYTVTLLIMFNRPGVAMAVIQTSL
jgi:hypothetical protein